MKTYKIKSLVYFAGFVMASILYYGIEQKQTFDEQLQAGQMAELEIEEVEDAKEEQVEDQP